MTNTTILIVEDELIAAESLSFDLQKLGYEVVEMVSTGEKAIEKANLYRPHLILMDIMLRGKMDGITAAQEIYQQLKIPIVYLSAYADDSTLQRAKSIPAYGYLVKPYKIADLKTTLTMALAKHENDSKQEAELVAEKQLNSVKSQALATASHDLRTPLTSILGYTELIRDYGHRFSAEKKERYFNFIKSAVGEMKDSLEDLLLISKAEEGKITLSPQRFDLVEFLQILVDEYNNLTDKHEITLLTDREKYQVYLDQKMLNHIVNNLISNAIKYSPQGGKITISLKTKPEEICLTVEDEGIGIPENYFSKLFHLFERGENVGKIKGNGLGLSIVKKTVDLLEGKIEVSSQENQGSKFMVTIPQ
jgi:signal transduction histidine kinase